MDAVVFSLSFYCSPQGISFFFQQLRFLSLFYLLQHFIYYTLLSHPTCFIRMFFACSSSWMASRSSLCIFFFILFTFFLPNREIAYNSNNISIIINKREINKEFFILFSKKGQKSEYEKNLHCKISSSLNWSSKKNFSFYIDQIF